MEMSKLSFFCLCEAKKARKRREDLHAIIFKNFLNCNERKRSSRSHGKENSEKLDCRPSNLVYAHIRTKDIQKKKRFFGLCSAFLDI